MGKRRKKYLTEVVDEIKALFKNYEQKAFIRNEIRDIYYLSLKEFKIYKSEDYWTFEDLLKKEGVLVEIKLIHQDNSSERTIFTTNDGSNFDIGLRIKQRSYFSHHTALDLLNLTSQVPKVYYLSQDLHMVNSIRQSIKADLTQDKINKAFSKEQRQTSNIYRIQNRNIKFIILERKALNHEIGVVRDSSLTNWPCTDVERTLIDIAIRPQYSGGIFSVIEAYNRAYKKIDLEKLNSYLVDFNYKYPYHQLIGFYLNRTGYAKNQLGDFSSKISNYRFYMTYNMVSMQFDDYWKVFYPKGINF
ncbi:type IV toxin-antitoxin system AbiEi family antitoxin domain-containing protein [Pareuzebyella sediminis]|uniref:type IV toxin-antitoxin system AbiEi family antitoxin domain-containing protein n=1 Tax=Pareuzebyella sediminis TaxID=2607998 RepID=UPI0011F07B72|nr:hypothetical protein [Pareuzebyella sediminis]